MTYLVKGVGVGARATQHWEDVANLATWRDLNGRPYRRPASFLKSASLHPLHIEVLGAVGKRLMESSDDCAVYGVLNPVRKSYRLVLGRPDTSVQLLPVEYSLGDEAIFQALTTTDDGTFSPGAPRSTSAASRMGAG